MLGRIETEVIHAPGLRKFPLIRAAAAAHDRCRGCHNSAEQILRLALRRYAVDKEFLRELSGIVPLPASILDVTIGQDENASIHTT